MTRDDYTAFKQACLEHLRTFFTLYPSEHLHSSTETALARLLVQGVSLAGKPGGWAGGIVYALASRGLGVPGILNSDLEKAFGASMGTIRKRARQVRMALLQDLQAENACRQLDDWTIREEANAICAFAFRNGPIEDLHAGKYSPLLEDSELSRVTDEEMKMIMIAASTKLAELLTMREQKPEQYAVFIRDYNRDYCRNWQR